MTAVCATPRVGIIECQFSTSHLQLFLALHLKGITRAIKFASHKTWTNEKNSLSCLVFRGSNLLVFFSFLFFKLESSFLFFALKFSTNFVIFCCFITTALLRLNNDDFESSGRVLSTVEISSLNLRFYLSRKYWWKLFMWDSPKHILIFARMTSGSLQEWSTMLRKHFPAFTTCLLKFYNLPGALNMTRYKQS